MSHISPVEKIEGQTSCFFFFTKTGLSFNLSNGQAAFSMPLVYSFYCKEFVVSLFHEDFSPLGGVCLLKILCQAKFRVG